MFKVGDKVVTKNGHFGVVMDYLIGRSAIYVTVQLELSNTTSVYLPHRLQIVYTLPEGGTSSSDLKLSA